MAIHPNLRPGHLLALGCLIQASLCSTRGAHADNPIVQHVYTADPAPFVHDDTVYLCTSHDEDVTVDDFFTMNDWRVFSSRDMVNWTDHGSPLSYHSFSWATGKAWAPHCVERNGKFYMFVPVSDAIGVAVADSPTGPFEDAIGRPLVSNYQYIDPTVYIDSDGQAYLFFGNPKLFYVKLNADMISYSGQIEQVPMTTTSFGQRNGDAERPTLYEEGPWFTKRNQLYYMLFAIGPLPEGIGYATSPGATGPWTHQGLIMSNQSGHAFTNHSGVVDFKGHSYFFYHTQELPGGGGFKRSVAVEEFTYNQDGTIPTINKTSQGVAESVSPVNPYARVEGETIAWGSAVEVEDCSDGGRDVTNIENGDFIKVTAVDFSAGALTFAARVASGGAGGNIALHLDGKDGAAFGSCAVQATEGWQAWQTSSCDVESVNGVHDLFLAFSGATGSLFNLDSWQFTPQEPLPSSSGSASSAGSEALPPVPSATTSTTADAGVASATSSVSAAQPPSASVTPPTSASITPVSSVASVSVSITPSASMSDVAPVASMETASVSSSVAEVPPSHSTTTSGCDCALSRPRPATPWSALGSLGIAMGLTALRAQRRRG